MKKLAIMAFMFAAISFAACGGNTTANEGVNDSDSVAVDSVDTTVVDSTVVADSIVVK